MTVRQKNGKKENLNKQDSPIPMLDLRAQYDELRPEFETVLGEILESGHFVLGKHVAALEQEIAAYNNVRHAISLASGTDALHLSLRALGIKPGDEVITTPFTFIAAAEAIVYVGATPVFADIDSDSLNIDPAAIQARITSKTKAIIPVHLFGRPANMTEIMELARENDLFVVEDCAQAFGAKYKNSFAGTFGNTGCFSFYPSKNLGAFGDGGIVITNNTDVYNTIKMLRNHGSSASYTHSFIGYNSRLDEIQAAILRLKLKHIDTYNQKRRGIAGLYTSILGDSVRCPAETTDRTHVYHQYTILSSHRDRIQSALKEKSISSVVYYPVPLHLQKAFGNLGYKIGDFPVSEQVAKEVLSLPMYPELKKGPAGLVAETIVNALK